MLCLDDDPLAMPKIAGFPISGQGRRALHHFVDLQMSPPQELHCPNTDCAPTATCRVIAWAAFPRTSSRRVCLVIGEQETRQSAKRMASMCISEK